MARIALITKVGPKDKGMQLNPAQYSRQATLTFLVNKDASEVKLEHFFLELKRLKLEPIELAMDLLIIACSMYAADTRINRIKFAEDSWTREMTLFIPVSDPSFWNTQKEKLCQIFKFLTGDLWEIEFRTCADQQSIVPKGRLKKYGMPYQTDTVCLFSGGMDSFIGAINLIASGTRPLLVGHAKSADVSPNQKFCEDALHLAFPQTPVKRLYAFIRIPKTNLFDSEEKTERGRSFLFFTLGAICASCLAPQSKLIVPENGLISLNIPLTPFRIGSHSTRTTHPHYMQLMQQLFDSMRLGVSISNPYQLKTKGEMLSRCANIPLVQSTRTMSCSHPSGRFQGVGNGHCGYCVPCLIRQAAFHKANVNELVKYYRADIFNQVALDTATKKDNIIAFKYLIEKTKTNPDYLKTLIRSTGPLGEDVKGYIDTYRRGLAEVEALLQNVPL